MCVFCGCVCVLVRESGCRNQVKRKSNTWLNGGDFSLNLLQPKMNMQCFHMCKCVHLCFCMFAHVPAGFIGDLSQCQVTRVSVPCVFLCVCVKHITRDSVRRKRRHNSIAKMNGNKCNTTTFVVWGNASKNLEKLLHNFNLENFLFFCLNAQVNILITTARKREWKIEKWSARKPAKLPAEHTWQWLHSEG